MDRQKRRQPCASTRKATVVLLAVVMVVASSGSIPGGEAFQSIPADTTKAAIVSTTSTCLYSQQQQQQQQPSSSSSSDSDADLLRDLPFVPGAVMAKFMAAVGDPLTAGSLQAGYQAGAVSADELAEIRSRLTPTTTTSDDIGIANVNEIPKAQSVETIEAHWIAALEGQPWHVQAMGKLAKATIVALVARMQEKSVGQATAMKWINENALPMIKDDSRVVELLVPSSTNDTNGANDNSNSNKNTNTNTDATANSRLVFNNTRAKYEDDRGVWSASMDVFAVADETSKKGNDDTGAAAAVSESDAALQALREGMGDEDISSFRVGLAEDDGTIATPSTTITTTSNSNKNVGVVGLVNAYFVPDDEIKILVVEIDGILHNVTWKGLD